MKTTRSRTGRGRAASRSSVRRISGWGDLLELASGQLALVEERAVEESDVDGREDLLELAVPGLPAIDVGEVEDGAVRTVDEERVRVGDLAAVRDSDRRDGQRVGEPDLGARREGLD